MFDALAQRLLPLLQLTRMALVFTAIADSYATAIMLRHVAPGEFPLRPKRMLAIAAVSIGLYGFGMSLNDIADRRRDRQLAAHRPIPSGRIHIITAHAFMLLLVIGALGSAAYYSWMINDEWRCLIFAVATGALISFYDLAGKYLVAPGLLALGLIRFVHALIPGPGPVLWHPLFLLNHVVILSALAYHWEEKRPSLTRIHWWFLFGGLALIDALLIVFSIARPQGLNIVFYEHPLPTLLQMIPPLAAAVVFVGIAWYVRARAKTSREAGQTVMLYGLLWLIVYDAAFVGSFAGWREAALLVLLFPMAYFSVQLMRWWAKILSLSQKPEFKRART